MGLNPDPTKQVQKVIFSRKLQNTNYPCLIFDHNTVKLTKSQINLGIFLDSRLDVKDLLKIIFRKVSKTIEHLYKLQNLLPRKPLIIIQKSFIIPKFDYFEIIYEGAYNA